MRTLEKQIQKDPVVQLLSRMAQQDRNSFSEQQIQAMQLAMNNTANHSIDFRPVVKVPLLPWSFYLVLLVGRNRREMSEKEQLVAARTLFALLVSGIAILAVSGLLVLYLIKSALGIDIFDNFSFGIWDWFSHTVLNRP